MSDEMVAIAMGVHVLDVLVRRSRRSPRGRAARWWRRSGSTAAGSAGGTAVTLAKLGARVSSAGAIGSDAVGEMLAGLLERGGVDTGHLVRRADVQTSASVLPIRPTGERPALHVIGANATYGPDDAPWDAIAGATHVHLGGPEFMGGEAAARILAHAREHGVTTSADILAPGEQAADLIEWIAPALPQLDYLLPNDEQALGLAREEDLVAACRVLVSRGVGCVVATRGADGVVIVDEHQSESVPAFEVQVVDTTGCGDAFSAGFLRGLSLGRSRPEAATLGCAAAAMVAQGLGTDYGDFDLAAADAMAAGSAHSHRAVGSSSIPSSSVSSRIGLDFYDAELRAHHKHLRAAYGIGRGDEILDIGCGTGLTTREAARAAAPGRVVGVDVSERMLERARELTVAERLENVSYEARRRPGVSLRS